MSTPYPVPRPPVPGPPAPRPRAEELTERFDPAALDGTDDQTPPRTGHPEVDRAVEGAIGLGSVPLADHPERLAQAHEALHAQLQNEPRDGARG